MKNSIHQKVRLTSDQIRNLPAFRKARRLVLKLEVMEGRVVGRGRTLILTTLPRARVRANRRSPASVRRATVDSGGDPEPEPPRSRSSYRNAGGAA